MTIRGRCLRQAARGADAVLILTDWKEFAALDFARLKECMRFPIVIDGRKNPSDLPQEMENQGFSDVSVGRPARHLIPERQQAG